MDIYLVIISNQLYKDCKAPLQFFCLIFDQTTYDGPSPIKWSCPDLLACKTYLLHPYHNLLTHNFISSIRMHNIYSKTSLPRGRESLPKSNSIKSTKPVVNVKSTRPLYSVIWRSNISHVCFACTTPYQATFSCQGSSIPNPCCQSHNIFLLCVSNYWRNLTMLDQSLGVVDCPSTSWTGSILPKSSAVVHTGHIYNTSDLLC